MRMLLSTVAVLLLGVFAYLFFNDYFRTPASVKPGDMLSNATPPAAPVQPLPPPMQPVVAPAPVVPVVQAPVAPPTPVQVVDATPPVAAPEVKKTHIVQRGDTLSSISREHYGTEGHFLKIATANGLKNRDRIRIGQVLVIPDLPAIERVETAERGVENDRASTTLGPDFEPIPPTLNIVVPKK
jgi:LysM repeat protein